MGDITTVGLLESWKMTIYSSSSGRFVTEIEIILGIFTIIDDFIFFRNRRDHFSTYEFDFGVHRHDYDRVMNLSTLKTYEIDEFDGLRNSIVKYENNRANIFFLTKGDSLVSKNCKYESTMEYGVSLCTLDDSVETEVPNFREWTKLN